MFLVNSHNPHFSATSRRSGREVLHASRHTFSRSYGVILRYGHQRGSVRGFSWKSGITELRVPRNAPHHLSRLTTGLSLTGPQLSPYGLEHGNHAPCWATLLRPRSLQRHPWWCRNINLLSITYASRPRLRIRLTHGRIILPQETLDLRRPGFSPGLSLLMPA